MIPPPEAISDAAPAGPNTQLAMMDMSKCAFFVYVDTDGHATLQAECVSKTQAAEWMRKIARSFEAKDESLLEPRTYSSPSGYVELIVRPWHDSKHAEAISEIEYIIEALRTAYLDGAE